MKSAFPETHKTSASAKSLQLAAELLRIQLIFPARFGGNLSGLVLRIVLTELNQIWPLTWH